MQTLATLGSVALAQLSLALMHYSMSHDTVSVPYYSSSLSVPCFPSSLSVERSKALLVMCPCCPVFVLTQDWMCPHLTSSDQTNVNGIALKEKMITYHNPHLANLVIQGPMAAWPAAFGHCYIMEPHRVLLQTPIT